MKNIWAIILAAGESKRMQVPKMLLPFQGRTMIEKVIENVNDSEVFNTLVVLGSFREEIMSVIKDHPVQYCFNRNYAEGMLSSVQCGFKNLPEDLEAAVVMPGDYPLVGPEVINKLLNAYLKTGKGIVIPVYSGRRGHPILIDSKYRGPVTSLDHGEGLRSLAARNPDDVLEVSVASSGILKDFDTREDYLNEINQFK